MAVTSPVESADERVGGPPPCAPGPAFWLNALGLLVILLALIPLVDNGALGIPDESLYAAQADTLAEGSWTRPLEAPTIDATGRWSVVIGGISAGDHVIPYARRPLYPLLLTPFWAVGSVGGGMILSVMGTWLAATAAGLLAARLDQRAMTATLWLVGIGSPLLFDAYTLTAHSLAAAAAGMVALAALRAVSASDVAPSGPRIRWGWAALAISGAALCTLVRTEGAIAVVSVAAALALTSLRRPTSVDRARLGFSVLLGGVAAATYALNDLWARAITSGGTGDVTAVDRQPDVLSTLWISVLRPWFPDNTRASASMVVIVLCSIVAPLAIRMHQRSRLLGLASLVVASVAAVIRSAEEPNLISGLLPTVPWLLVGLLSIRRSTFRIPSVVELCIACGLSTAMIIATAYGEGGAVEWGGRFFHVLLPLIAPVGVLGLLVVKDRLPVAEWRTVAVSLLVITTGVSVASLRANAELRTAGHSIGAFMERAVGSADADVTIYAPLAPSGTARLMWPVSSPAKPILTTPGFGALSMLLKDIPPNRTRMILVTDFGSTKQLDEVLSKSETNPWRVIRRTAKSPGTMAAYLIERV